MASFFLTCNSYQSSSVITQKIMHVSLLLKKEPMLFLKKLLIQRQCSYLQLINKVFFYFPLNPLTLDLEFGKVYNLLYLDKVEIQIWIFIEISSAVFEFTASRQSRQTSQLYSYSWSTFIEWTFNNQVLI